ncbi:I78 family peptidase inhibitor [Marimonas arenosa]|uniref:I78 family peptidase inhibitor n=1 Tax=Marimonas arenosa TaxID=1795305 RepID=A0AAE3WDG7_9RHOB|nr:I78 family peptidase inhibitor [Marimonas arenosa]MDQ2090896.1 I78 family peptidase inhibitor [Marimonas arenosa]
MPSTRRAVLRSLPALLALTACMPPDTPSGRPSADACGAAQYNGLIGAPVAQADFSGHAAVRIIPPGTAVTMDYRQDRLNVETDGAGIITRIYCG